MTGIERLKACVACKEVDRPGILPSYMDRFSATQEGLTFADILEQPDRASEAMRKTWDKLGSWGDAVYYAGGTDIYYLSIKHLTRIKLPGKDLPRDSYWQILEAPNVKREDYDLLINKGWNIFSLEMLPRIWEITDLEIKQYGTIASYHKAQAERSLKQYRRDTEFWREKGVEVFVGASVPSPQMGLSCARSLPEYTLDLYEIPDKVEAATWAALPDLIQNGIDGCKATGIPCVAVILERGSGAYYPLSFFERFEFPQLKKMIEAFVKNGITPLMHLDTDWTKNLPYFKEFPKGKVIASLDGTTNIFNAKRILQNHVCLMGDVPASLLVAGTPGEVEGYVRRLMEDVGEQGGFILGTGCSMPPNAKFENVKVMIDTCKAYRS